MDVAAANPTQNHPLMRLGVDDLNMITSFVLASGSIKALARQYSVSYPTMRNRLDSLITRLRHSLEERPADPLNDYLADLLAKGWLSAQIARRIRDLHRQQIDEPGHSVPHDGGH